MKNMKNIKYLLLVFSVIYIGIWFFSDEEIAESIQQAFTKNSEFNKSWKPKQACKFLAPSLKTKSYQLEETGIYSCTSRFKDIGQDDGFILANNLVYFAQGDAKEIKQLNLVLSVNQKDAAQAHNELLKQAKKLSQKATGTQLAPRIEAGIRAQSSMQEFDDNFVHRLQRKNWPSGAGYELQYQITRRSF